MLKRRLYEKLKDKLGELLFGFDEQQLDVGFFGGDVILKDLIFRPKKINEIFEQQNLPFALKAGMIAKMDIKVALGLTFPFAFMTDSWFSLLFCFSHRSLHGSSFQSQCRSVSKTCTSFWVLARAT